MRFFFMAMLISLRAFGADVPDGFASVGGNGLTTTTGGMGGETVTISTFADLREYAGASAPYIILVDGTIEAETKGAEVDVASNKTIVGLGDDATLYQKELRLIDVRNVNTRNLTDPAAYYDYSLDETSSVQAVVTSGAGPDVSIGDQYTARTEQTPIGFDIDITVARDGSGDYTTVGEAFDAVPDNRDQRTVIYLRNGTYHEKLVLENEKKNVTIIGEDRDNVKLTYDDYSGKMVDGVEIGTSTSRSTYIKAEGFCALNVTFENSSGPVGQALAIYIGGDKSVFYNCSFLGRQDTWFGRDCRQFLRKCYIEGTTDFIFGPSTAWFDSCHIHSYGGTAITAASTESFVPYGYVFSDCRVDGEPNVSTALGRPWRPYASVTYLNCTLGSCIRSEGWDNWGNPENESTARYSEYQNSGPGSEISIRVNWAKQLTEDEARNYTILNVLKTTYSDPPVIDNWDPLATLDLYVPQAGMSTAEIPGRIEAENYSEMSGVRIEQCSDEGGGENVGYIRSGAWVSYTIDALYESRYEIHLRMSGKTDGNTAVVYVNGVSVGNAAIPNTGSFHSWETVSTAADLDSGITTLRIGFQGDSGWIGNLNWIEFQQVNTYARNAAGIGARKELKVLENNNGLSYVLSSEDVVDISVYTLSGRLVESFRERKTSGFNRVNLTNELLSDNVFIYKIKTQNNGMWQGVGIAGE